MDPDQNSIGNPVNDDSRLDFKANYSNFLKDKNELQNFIENPFLSNDISCKYFTEDCFLSNFSGLNSPLVLNLNIQ